MANKGKDRKFKTNHSNNNIKCTLYIQFHFESRDCQTGFWKASSNYILSIGNQIEIWRHTWLKRKRMERRYVIVTLLGEASSPTMGVVRRQGVGKGWTKKDGSSVPPTLCLVEKLESPPSMNCCRVRHLQSPTLTVTQPGKCSQWGKWRREGIWVKDWFCLHVRAGLASRKVPTGSDWKRCQVSNAPKPGGDLRA